MSNNINHFRRELKDIIRDIENKAEAALNNGADQNDLENQEIFTFHNPTCFTCNGYYGPCFEDPICSTCHAFLYPNCAPNIYTSELMPNRSDDSDSGNDEPVDVNTYSGSADKLSNQPDAATIPPVQVEKLEEHISKLSVPRHEVQVNIEDLPPEVLMDVFKYLDEISLWSVGQVCVRWREILNMHIRPEHWQTFTLNRWPLLYRSLNQDNWYNMYTSMMESSWCIKCIRQMAAQEYSSVDENSWRKHRLKSELRSMKFDPLQGIQAKPLDSSCYHWQATIEGPVGSPYEGGLFFLYIQIPFTYPMCPPVIRFLTRILHPNISRHGDVGIDSIQHNWSLALTINKLLISIQSLLTDPYCDICMEPEVASLYVQDQQHFDETARYWTWKYAMNDLKHY